MEKMNVLTLVITLVVGVILTGALLGPVISDATKTHETFTNAGAFYVELDPTDTYTINYDKATETVLYINGEPLDVEFSTGYTILALDKSIMRLQTGDYTIQYKGAGQYITGITKLNLTIANGNVTGTYRASTVPEGDPDAAWPTTTYTKCYVASPEKEDLIMTQYNTVNKVTGDSEIFAFGQTLIQAETPFLALVNIEGTITDGVEVSLLDPTSGNVLSSLDVTDLSINKTAVAGYEDLYDLTSITFKVENETYSTDVTYSAYIVPAEVTAELSDHLTPGQISLMGAIPVMVIVALLMAAVGAIALRRTD